MKVKRYYRKQPLEPACVRAIHDVLQSRLKWKISNVEFILYYPEEELTITDIEQLDSAVDYREEKPTCISALIENEEQMFVDLATCDPETITIEVDPKENPPDSIIAAIEPILSLSPITAKKEIKSAFLAHSFDDEGNQYANEIARFLNLNGIITKSGREFSPDSISQKVRNRLSKNDIFFVILSPKADNSWLIQEMTAAKLLDKPIFILKQEEVSINLGLLGTKNTYHFRRDRYRELLFPF